MFCTCLFVYFNPNRSEICRGLREITSSMFVLLLAYKLTTLDIFTTVETSSLRLLENIVEFLTS
jgi:hypothetical protein